MYPLLHHLCTSTPSYTFSVPANIKTQYPLLHHLCTSQAVDNSAPYKDLSVHAVQCTVLAVQGIVVHLTVLYNGALYSGSIAMYRGQQGAVQCPGDNSAPYSG